MNTQRDLFADLPAALRRLMEARGFNQGQLALAAGIRQPKVSDYLAGKTLPTLDMLSRLLTALDATPADLATALDAESRLLPEAADLLVTLSQLERRIRELEAVGTLPHQRSRFGG